MSTVSFRFKDCREQDPTIGYWRGPVGERSLDRLNAIRSPLPTNQARL